MADLVVRLVVGSAAAYSATLRIWSPRGKSDVYAGERGITSQFKVSLHGSGECLAGLTSAFAAAEPAAIAAMGGERAQSRWFRKTHVGSQFVTPLQFSIPASELRPWRSTPPNDPKLTWIPAPADGHSIIVTCGFSGQAIKDENWPGRDNGVVLLAQKILPNGEKAWVLWQDCPTDLIEINAMRRAREMMASRGMIPFATTAARGPGPRTFVFDESRNIQNLLVIDSAIPAFADPDLHANERCN